MMPCISRKFSVHAKAFNSLSYYLVLIILLNNLKFSTSTLSTTVTSVLSSNISSHEPTCSNVKDILSLRGIADKDLPAKFPIKGENTTNTFTETLVLKEAKEIEPLCQNISPPTPKPTPNPAS